MEASERRLLAQEASRLGSPLDDAQLDLLARYVDLLRTWNARVRMLGDREPEALIQKHLPDCLALATLLPDAGPVADIGTGAGLPGLVLACVRPSVAFWLVESRRRRASFLHEATARLGLGNVLVVDSRAEDLATLPGFAGRASVVTARAVALDPLLAVAAPLLQPSGRVLVMQSQKEPPARIGASAARAGFAMRERRDYTLTGGEARRIVVLGRP
jgi:16S rRNA (guanine527-N7)-methyltransferase